MRKEQINIPALNHYSLQRVKRKEQLFSLCLSVPALISILLIIAIPIGWLFSLSFVNSSGDFSLENYQKMIEYKSYARVFYTTFKVSILTTALCVFIGYPLAYFLSQYRKYAGFFCCCRLHFGLRYLLELMHGLYSFSGRD